MSKDTIFEQKPKKIRKKYDYFGGFPFVRRNEPIVPTNPTYLVMKHIDLKNYREVKQNEILEINDIYYSKDKEGWVYTQLVGQTSTVHNYYRKIEKNKRPEINLSTHTMLFPSDVLEEGDEFFTGSEAWTKTHNVGQKVGHLHFYRRMLKPL